MFGVSITAGKACCTLNKCLNKWLNQTDLISNDDELFLKKIVKICSDVSYIGGNAFRKPYLLTNGEATKARFEDIVSKLADVGIATEGEVYKLKIVTEALTDIWIINGIVASDFIPIPSVEEWFRRFKYELGGCVNGKCC